MRRSPESTRQITNRGLTLQTKFSQTCMCSLQMHRRIALLQRLHSPRISDAVPRLPDCQRADCGHAPSSPRRASGRWCRRRGSRQAGMWHRGHTSLSRGGVKSFPRQTSSTSTLMDAGAYIYGRPRLFQIRDFPPSADHVGGSPCSTIPVPMRPPIQRRGPSLPADQIIRRHTSLPPLISGRLFTYQLRLCQHEDNNGWQYDLAMA